MRFKFDVVTEIDIEADNIDQAFDKCMEEIESSDGAIISSYQYDEILDQYVETDVEVY